MLPVLAIGALLAGGIYAIEATGEGSSSKSASSKGSRPEREPQKAAAPQSYLVTPMNGASDQPGSVVEAVNRFIV